MPEGLKHDAVKPRPLLILRSMARALQAVIEVGEHGARTYSEDNWLQVPGGIERYTNAMLRHQLKELAGDNVDDPDSGLTHAAHIAWNSLARLELMIRANEHEKD